MRVRPQLFIASLSALCFTWCSHAGAEDLIVRIGQVSPLTGNIAHLGKDAENGVRMALDEANARGIVIAGRKIQFLLASEDDAAEPRQAGERGVFGGADKLELERTFRVALEVADGGKVGRRGRHGVVASVGRCWSASGPRQCEKGGGRRGISGKINAGVRG